MPTVPSPIEPHFKFEGLLSEPQVEDDVYCTYANRANFEAKYAPVPATTRHSSLSGVSSNPRQTCACIHSHCIGLTCQHAAGALPTCNLYMHAHACMHACRTGVAEFFPGLDAFLGVPAEQRLPLYNTRFFSKSVWDIAVAGVRGVANLVLTSPDQPAALAGAMSSWLG